MKKADTLWLLLLAVPAGMLLWRFSNVLLHEAGGPLTWDSTLYLAVGRGILNGLTPYVDLFETKPPGVFLLSALSIWLTGGHALASWLQTLAIALFPPAVLWLGVSVLAKKLPRQDAVPVVLTLLFGLVWALYVSERSGAFQVESFGAVFGALFLVAAASGQTEVRWARKCVAALFLLLAVGMKEPFLLSIAGTLLLLYAHDPKQLIPRLLHPLAIAVGAGVAAMLLLGYLWPYLGVYLPEMLGNHIHSHGTLFQKIGNTGKLWRDLEAFIPLLGVGAVASVFYVAVRQVRQAPLQKKSLAIVLCAIGVSLAVYAVGMGGQYWNHHFVFAVPLYLAATAVFCADMFQMSPGSRRRFYIATGVVFAWVFALNLPEIDYARRLQNDRQAIADAQMVAYRIDSLLEACEQERYLYLGGNGIEPYAFTKHSPWGPNFFQYNYFFTEDRPFFREKMKQNLSRAGVVIRKSYEVGQLRPGLRNFLEANYTTEPWPCAAELATLPHGYDVLFAKKGR